MPFKHINDAAKIARPGDVVSVAPGVSAIPGPFATAESAAKQIW